MVVTIGIGGHLRQVRDAEHLARPGQPLQARADGIGGRSPDPRVDLVEHQRPAGAGVLEHHVQRQHDPRQLAARGGLAQRPGVLARIRRDQELGPLDAARRQRHRAVAVPELRPARRLEADREARPRQGQLAQLPLDGRGQRLRGAPPCRAEPLRLARVGLRGERQSRLGRADLLAEVLELVELRRGRRAVLEHLLLVPPVARAESLDRGASALQVLQPVGVALALVRVVAERGSGLLQLELRRADALRELAEPRVQLGQPLEPARAGRRQAGRAGVSVVELGQRLSDQLGDLDPVTQPRPLALQLVAFPGAWRDGIDLPQLAAQVVGAPLALTLGLAQPLQALPGLADRALRGGDPAQLVVVAAEAVQQLEVAVGGEQAVLLVLAVQLQQPLAELAQRRDGAGRAVDEHARRSADRHLAAQHQQAVLVGVDAALLQQRTQRPGVGRLEHRLDARAARPASDLRRVGAVAGDQSQRVDQDRLARPGLAGQQVQARTELHGQVLDDRQLTDAQRSQHRVHPGGRRGDAGDGTGTATF